MLANQRLIMKMSIGQKIKLITSPVLYESSSDDGYEFPVLRLVNNPVEDLPNAFITQFPDEQTLARCWNMPLVAEAFGNLATEVRANKKYAYFNVSAEEAAEKISDQHYFTGRFLAGKIRGITRGGAKVNFEEKTAESDYSPFDRILTQAVMAESSPDSVLSDDADRVDAFKKEHAFNNLTYGCAETPEQVAKFLFNGCTLVFLKSDFTEEVISYLTGLTESFAKVYSEYRSGKIKVNELDRLCREFSILDGRLIDEACDRIISALLDMRDGFDAVNELKTSIKPYHAAKFDEPAHAETALAAARESVVLLKNENILPLSPVKRVAVIGEYAKDLSYQSERYKNKSTADKVPFDVINDYDINTVGFAYGYMRGNNNPEFIATAVRLCSDADCALIYLCAEDGSATLPENQTRLLDELYGKGVKIIAVVAADAKLNLSFSEKCAAVLYTGRCGQETTTAVLEILTGQINPSGRLTCALPATLNGKQYAFPFGFGLSYTSFTYKNLAVSRDGISCTVRNEGDRDGYAVVQFYLQKKDSKSEFAQKILKGFSKVFVKKHDSVRVEFSFDENTFKSINAANGRFHIEGGEYTVFVSENDYDDKLTGTLTLDEYSYDDEFENKVIATSKGKKEINFTVTKQQREINKAKKQLSFGMKLFLAIVLAVYYNGVIAVFALTNIISDKNIIYYLVLGALALVFDVIFVIYAVVISKKRKKQNYIETNDVLTDMIEKVKDFDEIAKVVYKTPLNEEQAEEVCPPEQLDDEQTESEKSARAYNASFNGGVEEVAFVKTISLNELCANFRDYAKSKGLAVELSSVRTLISAISASKIVIVSSKNAELMPLFLKTLNSYFGNSVISSADDGWHNSYDIIWRQGSISEESYVLSDFINTVHSACASKNKNCIAILDNVNLENVTKYFSDFISYANCPNEEHILSLNGEQSLALPDNICYILSLSGQGNKVPDELVDASTFVDLVLSAADAAGGEEVEIKFCSRETFCGLIRDAREKYYLSEKLWKRIDEFIETINKSEKFVLGNKNTLQLERLSSALIDCGSDENEAFVNSFVSKVVPVLKKTATYAKEDGEKTLSGLIEKLFPDEDVAKINKSLAKTA